MSAATSSGTYAAECIQEHLRHVVDLQADVLADRDPEPLHQLRVRFRRLRSTLLQFAPALLLPSSAADGRIAKIGSVKVTEAFVVERYSHVMHIVSNVEGLLLDGADGQPLTSMDVLKATFPAGTLTGAPKVHAMELIDQLEPTKRGLYGGACGYLSFAGDMDVAIAIRTGIIKNDTLYVQAAAGVVADSVPELEWRETEHKARALLRASELVEEGLE